MPKMKNTARADGRVQSRVYLGDGKYKYVYAANNKELQEKVTELKTKLGKGIDLLAEHDSLDSWGKRWLKRKTNRVSENWAKALDINYRKLEPLLHMEVNRDNISQEHYKVTSKNLV